MTQVVPFVFSHDQQQAQVRVVRIGDDPWFVGVDVCDALGFAGVDSLRRLKSEQKGLIQIQTPGGPQRMNVINESGLYLLAMRSDKERARAFQDWIAEDVLPSLRRTGTYALPAVAAEQHELLSAINGVQKELADQRGELAGLKREVRTGFGEIKGKLGSLREGFSADAVRYACEGTANYNNCECIYCNEEVVVTRYGEKLPNGREHHADGNRANCSKENCVIPCLKCHDRLHYASRPDHIPAYLGLSVAQAFHMKLKQKATRIKAPDATAVKFWDMRAATQTDMGFQLSIKTTKA